MKLYVVAGVAILLAIGASPVLAQNGTVEMLVEQPMECSQTVAGARRLQSTGTNQTIHLSSENVHWGYFYSALNPAAVVASGETIIVETATQHAGDDYDKMVKGDPGMEDIYQWTQNQINTPFRGRTGHGDGVHILTGPIYVCGAEAGDVLQVDILDLEPRVNPATGKTYGSNAATSWGYQFKAGFLDGIKREVITIYEILRDSANNLMYAVPDYQFRYNAPEKGYVGPKTSCTETFGLVPETANGIHYEWNNTGRTYRYATPIPCVNGTQTWTGYLYPGVITSHPTGTEDYSIRGKFKVPLNFHIGNMGLASYYGETVDSVPPGIHGGNVDDRRIGKGATMYYPVQVNGALLSLGDCHTAQGDSEFDGTAIETSLTATLKVTLHKKGSLPRKVSKLTFPLLENANEYIVHGFNYGEYLKQLKKPSTDVYKINNLTSAFTNTYNNTRDFVMTAFNLTEDQAITAITVGVDFSVSQVVNGNWGMQTIIPKWMFNMSDTGPYTPKVMSGTSKIASTTLMTSL